MRTRYAHQVTVMVLDSMLNIIAYEDSWLLRIGSWYFFQQSPTFKFWLLVHKYQQIIFIRVNRERKLELMVSTLHLQRLTALFFALDHQNYAR